MKNFTILLLILICHTISAQTTLYVDKNASGLENGTDWNNAYTSLKTAISSANAGSTILIAEGTYNEGEALMISKAINLKGGYPNGGGVQNTTNHLTVLDGNTSHRVLHITTTNNVSVEGVTIQNGKIVANPGKGGGIYAESNSLISFKDVIVKDNIATTNSSDAKGGGLYVISGNVTLTDSQIINNKALTESGDSDDSFGGGIYSENSTITLKNSKVMDNEISTSAFYFNTNAFGGGIFNEAGDTILANSEVSNNLSSATANSYDAVSIGGGIYSNSGNIKLTNSLIKNNTASSESFTSATNSKGGGIHSESGTITVNNSQINNNTSTTFTVSGASKAYAGGISNSNATIVLNNSQISGNKASSFNTTTPEAYAGGVMGNITLNNSILWDNAKSTDGGATLVNNEHEMGALIANHSLIKDLNPVGNGNIDAEGNFDPKFIDPENGDFRLQSNSPLSDAGNNMYLPNDEFDVDNDGNTVESLPIDLEGKPRITGNNLDIGVYEYRAQLSTDDVLLKKVSLHPNPATNLLNIDGLQEDTVASIYNIVGQQIKKLNIYVNNSSIDVSKLPIGVYMLKLKNTTRKFIKR